MLRKFHHFTRNKDIYNTYLISFFNPSSLPLASTLSSTSHIVTYSFPLTSFMNALQIYSFVICRHPSIKSSSTCSVNVSPAIILIYMHLIQIICSIQRILKTKFVPLSGLVYINEGTNLKNADFSWFPATYPGV